MQAGGTRGREMAQSGLAMGWHLLVCAQPRTDLLLQQLLGFHPGGDELLPRFCGHGLVGLRPAGQAQGELADLKRRRPCSEATSQTATWAKTPTSLERADLALSRQPHRQHRAVLSRPQPTGGSRAPHTHRPPSLRPRQGLAASLKLSEEGAFFCASKLLPLEMGNGLANAFQHQDVIFFLFRVHDGQATFTEISFRGRTLPLGHSTWPVTILFGSQPFCSSLALVWVFRFISLLLCDLEQLHRTGPSWHCHPRLPVVLPPFQTDTRFPALPRHAHLPQGDVLPVPLASGSCTVTIARP